MALELSHCTDILLFRYQIVFRKSYKGWRAVVITSAYFMFSYVRMLLEVVPLIGLCFFRECSEVLFSNLHSIKRRLDGMAELFLALSSFAKKKLKGLLFWFLMGDGGWERRNGYNVNYVFAIIMLGGRLR